MVLNMTTLTVFDGWNIDVDSKDEPRVHDLAVATRAGLSQPLDIRRVIERPANWAELTAHGEIKVIAHARKPSGGRPGREYWLTEAQAVSLMSMLRTKQSRDLRVAIVQLFVAYRRGQITSDAAPLPLDIAHGVRLRDDPRLRSDMALLCGMTARSTSRSLQTIYGFVRRTYRVGSPFDVAALAWPIVKSTLEAIALGKLMLPRRPLPKLPPDRRQTNLFGPS